MITGAHTVLYSRDADALRACFSDVLEATMTELAEKGVELGPVTEQPWGRLTAIVLPDGGELGLYEPRHPRP